MVKLNKYFSKGTILMIAPIMTTCIIVFEFGGTCQWSQPRFISLVHSSSSIKLLITTSPPLCPRVTCVLDLPFFPINFENIHTHGLFVSSRRDQMTQIVILGHFVFCMQCARCSRVDKHRDLTVLLVYCLTSRATSPLDYGYTRILSNVSRTAQTVLGERVGQN